MNKERGVDKFSSQLAQSIYLPIGILAKPTPVSFTSYLLAHLRVSLLEQALIRTPNRPDPMSITPFRLQIAT